MRHSFTRQRCIDSVTLHCSIVSWRWCNYSTTHSEATIDYSRYPKVQGGPDAKDEHCRAHVSSCRRASSTGFTCILYLRVGWVEVGAAAHVTTDLLVLVDEALQSVRKENNMVTGRRTQPGLLGLFFASQHLRQLTVGSIQTIGVCFSRLERNVILTATQAVLRV